MYTLGVRDHLMIAHSFKGEIFGPAQQMHGATYIVDVEFSAVELDKHGLVVDIGWAQQQLKAVLQPLNYQNLDNLPEFAGTNTTTEFLAKEIFRRLGERVKPQFNGRLKVTLHESHIAWASYENQI
ncbi:MAG: 6-carboxytetrahydropterin synthase [Gemmatimonadetes bacterium]|nr:MAG: 6-carboxytetrahydropterin synthase [Gemmatimonadota bacterium]